ncbi:MAG: hypothetical protein IJ830_06260 [Alphaproteobacteria bacterium]|nr:hypothetical protein [Alphaproteobacteria bacterium]
MFSLWTWVIFAGFTLCALCLVIIPSKSKMRTWKVRSSIGGFLIGFLVLILADAYRSYQNNNPSVEKSGNQESSKDNIHIFDAK